MSNLGWTTKVDAATGRKYMEGPKRPRASDRETLLRFAEQAAIASEERDLREAAARGDEILAGETNLPRRREAIEHTRRKRANRTS